MDAIKWPRGQTHAFRRARQYPFHWCVQTRPSAQERAGDVGELFWAVLRSCRPIHAVEFRAMLPTGHSEINLSIHLHAEIGLSHSLRAPFKYRMY